MVIRLISGGLIALLALVLVNAAGAEERPPSSPAPQLRLAEEVVRVEWGALEGAASYELRVWAQTDTGIASRRWTGSSTSTSVQLGELGEGARKVRAKVRAYDERGRHGWWSSTSDWMVIRAPEPRSRPPRTLSAEVEVEPVDLQVSIKLGKDGMPVVRWEPLPGSPEIVVHWDKKRYPDPIPSTTVEGRHKLRLIRAELSRCAPLELARSMGQQQWVQATVVASWSTGSRHSQSRWIAFPC